jgi:hypothetical protein
MCAQIDGNRSGIAAAVLGRDAHDHTPSDPPIQIAGGGVMRLPHRKARSRRRSAELRANAQVGAQADYDSVWPISAA